MTCSGADAELSWALARSASTSALEAQTLIDEARDRAAQLASIGEFKAHVRAVAEELLARGELDGEQVNQLIKGGA